MRNDRTVSVHSILLVEDDSAFARFIIGSFRDVDPGLELFHVNNGYAALSVINNGFHTDLIICEDRMPRMSGSELLTSIRANPSYQAVPIYTFTTSFTDDVPAVPGRLSIDMKLPRPSNYREAISMINKIRTLVSQEAHGAGETQAVTI
jgi:two-component system chemotaxis response regulator CheY